MKGISIGDLENIVKQINTFNVEVKEKHTSCSNQLNVVSDCYSGVDLSFLTDALKECVSQYDTIEKNNENYATTIQSVIQSYQDQNMNIQHAFGSIKPQ